MLSCLVDALPEPCDRPALLLQLESFPFHGFQAPLAPQIKFDL